MPAYYRPLVLSGPRPAGALPLAGGPLWFAQALELTRGAAPHLVAADAVPEPWRTRLSAPRAPVAGLSLERPRIMGILNVTPDSFSDGGAYLAPDTAVARAGALVAEGADLVDIGGESTRPGATEVPEDEETARIAPVFEAVAAIIAAPLSVDTRKASVARAAAAYGAALVNDVSGLTFDAAMTPFVAGTDLPVCVMHAQGLPETMQDAPYYDDAVLDIYDWLAARIDALEAAGIPRARIVADPGIGFGKTTAHNMALLHGLALFHGLGCALLLGASRKGFIARLAPAPQAGDRLPGSLAAALAGAGQGVQMLRVHDVAETVQALAVWHGIARGEA